MQTTRFNVYPRGAKQRKKEHPQKYFVKKICDVLFYLGAGNYWYEDRNLTNSQQYIYNIYAIIVNIYLFGNSTNIFLAYLRSDLTSKEQNDVVLFIVAHSCLMSKVIMLYAMKKRIKIVLKRFFEEKREFSRLDLDMQSLKKAKMYCGSVVFVSYLTLSTATIDGITMHFKEGIPIRTEVVYFPTPSHSGLLINILRVLVEVHWWYFITVMLCIDCLCTCCLVFTGFKFRTLKVFFEGLEPKLQADPEKNLEVLEEKYIKDFERGISFHKEILWCTRNVQYALGNLYSLQIVEGVGNIAICLLKFVNQERNVWFLIANLSFTFGLAVLTGSYMLSAGDIIYEADMIPTAIFHSGWELTKLSKKIRHLVVTTLILSQVPVYMTSFGIVVLSYDNFIAVMRLSYSFFAVMY